MKKTLSLALVLALVCSLFAGVAFADEKQTINLWSFTDEVPGMVDKYVATHPDFAAKYDVKTTIIATTDGLYQPALDVALENGEVDMFAAEAAFILKYAQGDYSEYAASYADLMNAIGKDINAEIEAADIAQYSIEIGSRDGELVALGYQATGGAFIYRRSIAKAVWGTDDPAVIADKIGPGWEKFYAAAAELRAAGYAIVSGDGDIWHAVENSSEMGWLDEDEMLVIDPAREAFLDLSKELKDNDYHNDTTDWTEAWYADMAGVGTKEVFGFFGPAWLINYVMAGNSGDTYGDWAVAVSPIGFFWGGTWLLGVDSSDVKAGVAELIYYITLDATSEGLQYAWANGTLNGEGGTKDTVASGTVMSISNGELDFLGGQNMFDVFVPANQYANGKNLTQYDESINSLWRDQVRMYTSGQKTRDEAIASFKQNVADQLGIEAK